ncbi:hypothetical protein ANN_05595 [Periplaneta americana]|uniref:Uncharacterized protein n=1 Tax=Periplaneta americana TaxID=6978 RepID=A0ABQ8TBD8_PERAM|nr:hypothetical protein ANN_05595 [Periplaneta americana]
MLRYCGRLLAPNWRLLAPGRRSSTECRQTVKVTLIGTCNTTNQTAALLLKQNTLISELSLVSNESTAGIAMDLRHVTTNCAVNNFQGLKELGSAVKV